MKNIMILLLFLFLACAPTTTHSDYSPGNREITPEDIRRHVSFLASDKLEGRFPGTTGSDLAAAYIRDAFRAAGIKPYNGVDYYQDFDFVKNVILGPGNTLTVSEGNNYSEALDTSTFIPLGFSSTGNFTGGAVFAGYGFDIDDSVSWHDYDGLDVENAWSIVFRGGPDDSPHSPYGPHMAIRKKALVARDKGALGLILVSGSDDDKGLIRLRYDYAFGDAGIPVIHVDRGLAEDMFERAGYDLAEVETYLKNNLSASSFSIKGITIEASISLEKETVSIPNVVGILPGSDTSLSDEIIVIGAHFDHLGWGGEGSSLMPDTVAIHNGADDNASGVAGILELAEYFGAYENRPARSLMFAAFNAEEKGSLGSKYLTENFPYDLKNVVAMVNLDMVGRLTEKKLNIGGTGTSPVFPGLLDTVNSDYDFAIKKSPDGYGPSDHANFYTKDIPVLFFFTGTHNDYHKPGDDTETLNIDGEALLVRYIYDIVNDLGNTLNRPDFSEAGPKENTAARASFKVTLGIIPSYASQAEGLEIDGTRRGGPAENAGMLKGDIIIAIDGKEIKNIYDYMYRLAELSSGQIVIVTVVRGEGKLELTLQL